MSSWIDAVELLAEHARKYGVELDRALDVTDYQHWSTPTNPATLFLHWITNSQNRAFGYPLPESNELRDSLVSVFGSSDPLSTAFHLHSPESELASLWKQRTFNCEKLASRFISTILSSAAMWRTVFAEYNDDDALDTLTRYALNKSIAPSVFNYMPTQIFLVYKRLVVKNLGIQLVGNFFRDYGVHWGFKGDRHLQRMLSMIYFRREDAIDDPSGNICLMLATDLANSMGCELARLDKLLWVASSARLSAERNRYWTRKQGKIMEEKLIKIVSPQTKKAFRTQSRHIHQRPHPAL